ncbi:MAG: AAA family ATPase [Bacteriovoracaceae bacterium]
MKTFVILICWTTFIFSNPGFAEKRFIRDDISDAKFGTEKRAEIVAKIANLQDSVSKDIIGQDRVARMLQERLMQWMDNFGTRKADPVAMHLIGFPGIGKSAILRKIEESGIKVIHIDVQEFAGENAEIGSLKRSLYDISQKAKEEPTVIIFDELDKVPEIVGKEAADEETKPIIGLLNKILTDGEFLYGTTKVNLSNTTVVTAMNFSPEMIEEFSEEVFGENKSFYDLNINDFKKIDDWLRASASSREKVLSQLFRSNTVSRLSPNTVIVKPLNENDYREIIRRNVETSIISSTSDENAGKKLTVTFTEEFIDLLEKVAVNPSSGARETVFRVNLLTQQVISIASKYTGKEKLQVNRPREIVIGTNAGDDQIEVKIVGKKFSSTDKALYDDKTAHITLNYNHDDRQFERPAGVQKQKPKSTKRKTDEEEQVQKITKKSIREARFPKKAIVASNIANKVNESIVGQENLTADIEKGFQSFLSRPTERLDRPSFSVLAGFPGIGKTRIAELFAEHADLKIIKINLQEYAGSTEDAVFKFLSDLEHKMGQIEAGEKFVLLIEEIDKIPEIDEKGAMQDRPILGIIKELLNSGRVKRKIISGSYSNDFHIDVRRAFTMLTMNFRHDLFGFEADPRLTSISDVMNAWRSISGTLNDRKKILSSLFLPDTISRIINQTHIVKPLSEPEYSKVIDITVDGVVVKKFINPETGVNNTQIDINLDRSYKDYLFSESVIPSEGARNTVISVETILGEDIEQAINSIPRSSDLAAVPVEFKFEFREKSKTKGDRVVLKAREKGSKGRYQVLLEKEVMLKFPSPKFFGRMPEKRIHTSLHEFGHAFAAVRLGTRFTHVVVIPPSTGTGGYVKFMPTDSHARTMISRLHATLAARAMEKIFFAPDPLAPDSSLYITSGPSSDIKQATSTLHTMMQSLGFDPRGGVADKHYAPTRPFFDNLSQADADKYAMVLQDIENHMIKDFLEAHSKEWYIKKITNLAQNGIMNEQEFYELIEYVYPGEKAQNFSGATQLREAFSDIIELENGEIAKASKQKMGTTQITPKESLDKSIDALKRSILTHFGDIQTAQKAKSDNCLSSLTSAVSSLQ